MNRLALMFTLAVLVLACFAIPASAQQPANQPDSTIDPATKTQLIDTALKRLTDSYVFPDVAKKMETSIRERAAKGEYDAITSARAFATKLTEDLQAVSKDKHLRMRYSHESLPVNDGPGREPNAAEREEERRELNWMNHGF